MVILEPIRNKDLSLLWKSRLYRNSETDGQMRKLINDQDLDALIIPGVLSQENQNIMAWSYLWDSGIRIGYTEIGVYVNSKFRGGGLGRKIVEEAIRIHKTGGFPSKLLSRPWNFAGRKFFKQFEEIEIAL